MGSDVSSLVVAAAVAGIVAGLWLLGSGLAARRRVARIADIATSPIGAIAVGEVRVTGVVEPAELTLVSPLQSRICVYYRSQVREGDGRERRTVFEEQRAVGFRVRDASGTVRVFPRDAAWDVPDGFGGGDGPLGAPPTGLAVRSGPAFATADPDRDELVARLLTVAPVAPDPGMPGIADPLGLPLGHGDRDYREAWLEPGETVTIVGTALPFAELPDPEDADLAAGATAAGGPQAATDDPEIAADLAAARAAGTLETDPREAWGNAAIPGFGIGRPVSMPELDPAARALPLADAATAERTTRRFEIAPEALVIAAGPDRPLLVSRGAPSLAVARQEDRFLAGLAGAILAIVSAVVLALELGAVR